MANNKNRHHRASQPSREVQGDKEVLSRPIESLGLPENTLELLKNNRFNTILDLAKRTEREMFRVQTFNKKHLTAVKNAINAAGIDFAPFIPRENDDNVVAQKSETPAVQKPDKINRKQSEKGQNNTRPQQGGNGRPLQNTNGNQNNNGQKFQNGKPQQINKPQQTNKPDRKSVV